MAPDAFSADRADAVDGFARPDDTRTESAQAAKMAALAQFVAGAAHELNNPLSVIIACGQLLLARETPEGLRRPIELMVAESDRMAKIVQALSFFARQRPPARDAVDLQAVLELVLARRTPQLARAAIRVETQFAAERPEITGDARQLEQVFLNLLLNAEQAIRDARPSGRIVVRTRVSPRGDLVHADVVDDGRGVPPDLLPRIFEPFFTTRDVGNGTGLGLSVAYGIVEAHGGRLAVHQGGGETTFTVELPATPAARPAPPGGILRGDGGGPRAGT